MSKKVTRIILWLAVAVCMAVIFSFSMENGVESAESSGGFIRTLLEQFDTNFSKLSYEEQRAIIESHDHFIRKLAHFSIYALLGVLVSSTLSTYAMDFGKTALFSVAICAIYAISDEIHQYFVPGRACMIRDMLLDTSGSICGILLISLILYSVRRKKKKR